MKIFIFIPMIMILFCCSCQRKSEAEQLTSLEGIKWKLAGIFDTKTGALKVLEPKDCDECYTLTFEPDSFFNKNEWFNGKVEVKTGWYKISKGYSSSNILACWYNVDYITNSFQIYNIGGTEVNELFDGRLYRETLLSVQSFLLKNELILYFDDKSKYLLFKQPINN